ncbi:MAG: hypothetical protein IBJ10_09605 [Phycisphaerales bacterium]|nr:hypothetical protein [Phycisphaerales bacterium]
MRLALLALLAVACGPGAASAAVTGVVWRIVAEDTGLWNRPYEGMPQNDVVEGANWASMIRVTCDLYLTGTPGQRINGVNMGDSNAPSATPFALHTNATVFNHSLGSNVQSAAEFPPFNSLAYDTFVDLGGTQTTPNISFAGGTNLTGSGGVLRGTWFTTDEATLDQDGRMRILRVTIGVPFGHNPFFGGYFLGTPGLPGQEAGGPVSRLEVGLPNGELVQLYIGTALYPPTPGATALLGIAGAAGLRRRRAESHLFTQKQLIGG